MSKRSAMPVSRAKTAYGLLSEIRKLILEEPRRYNQWDTLSTGRDTQHYYGPEAPPCGTVGCVAGWVVALKKPHSRSITGPATEILGLIGSQDVHLFGASQAGPRASDSLKSHAKRGAAHIAKFQKKYAAQLKAKRV